MKKLTILSALFFSVLCSFDECNQCTEQSQCPSINIEYTGFSCYKYENEYIDGQCVSYPNNKTDQKAFYNMQLTYLKELIPSFFYYDLDDIMLYGPEKKTYNKGDTMKAKITKLSPIDKEILDSKNTCLYQLYGKYIENYENGGTSYSNIKDKNICFNTYKFDEALNLLDCGYAEITFSLNGKNYNMTTCYPFPNRKMPELIQTIYNKYFIESQIGTIKSIGASEKNQKIIEKGEILLKKNRLVNIVEKPYEKISEEEIKKLQSTGSYEFVIENKYGKKYKYTEQASKPTVISEGNIEQENQADDIQTIKTGKSNFFKLNIFFSLILILFL